MSTPMRIDDLLAGYVKSGAHADVIVRGLSLDSRTLAAGDAFIALQGSREHGIDFAAKAFAAGASIVIAESAVGVAENKVAGPVVWVEGLRGHVGAIAARFFGVSPLKNLVAVASLCKTQ